MRLSNLPPGVTDRMIEDQADVDDDDVIHELQSDLERLERENAALKKALRSDATLAGCVSEIERLSREVQVLKERNDGLMQEKAQAISEKNRIRRIMDGQKGVV